MPSRPLLLTLLAASAGIMLLAGCNADKDNDPTPAPAAAPAGPRVYEKIDDPHLTNAFKFTSKVWGGAEPHDEDAFRVLKAIGVKTILSVDGAKPDVEMARKYGLRYVHLPFGYDDLPEPRAEEIAKAITELPGPIYLHCHHGKHRSAAAVATACVLNGTLNNEDALEVMTTAGTGENYLGLWAAARNARPLDRKTLKNVKVEYREQAPIPPLADAMVEIDDCLTHLELCKAAEWASPKDHPALDPPHEALKLREHFTEMQRTEDYTPRPQQFKDWTVAAETAAKSLEDELRASPRDKAKVDAGMLKVTKSCKDCHAAFRNVPQHK